MFKKEKITEAMPPVVEEAKPEFPNERGAGQGSGVGYTVEARYNSDDARVICGMPLTRKWQHVSTTRAPSGVPTEQVCLGMTPFFEGVLNYPAAQALRWWFIAAAAVEHNDLLLETRLVEHRCEYTWKDTTIRAVNETDGYNRRPKAVGDG